LLTEVIPMGDLNGRDEGTNNPAGNPEVYDGERRCPRCGACIKQTAAHIRHGCPGGDDDE